MNRARITAAAVGVVLVGLIALFAFGDPGDSGGTDASRLMGRRVPAIAGATLDGGEFDIDGARGQWVLVNFFATWCAPCIAEHPELVKLEEWGDENGSLQLVSIVFDDEPENVRELFDQLGGSWPVMNAPGAAVDFQIRKVPESFLINPDGVVVAHVVSGVTADRIISEIEGAS